jgi:hypothetical protein
MKRITYFLLLTGILFTSRLAADVVEPGEIQRQFKVINLDAFPGHDFYILYTGYHYHQGYQPNEPFRIWLEQDSVYSTSSRDDNSLIYAVNVKDSGEVWASDISVGGGDIVSSERIYTVIDVVRIKSVQDQKVEIEFVKEIVVYKDGSTREKRAKGNGLNGLPPGAGGGTPGWMYWLMPALSLLAIVFFLLWRRKKNRKQPDAGLAV